MELDNSTYSDPLEQVFGMTSLLAVIKDSFHEFIKDSFQTALLYWPIERSFQ